MPSATWDLDNVHFGEKSFKLAPLMVRLGAKGLDFLVICLILALFTYGIKELGVYNKSSAAKAALVTFFGILFFFEEGMDGGLSIGKRICGVRVLDIKSGNPCGLVQSFVRGLGLIFPLAWAGIFGARRQHVGDRWAATVVVVDRPSLFDERAYSVLGPWRRNATLCVSLYLVLYAGFYLFEQHDLEPKTYTRGDLSLEIPQSWSELPLNTDAMIQIGNERREEYLIVIAEESQGWPLDEFAQAATNMWTQRETVFVVGQASALSINGHKALQQQLQGHVDGVELSWLLTTLIIGRLHFQIVAWSLTENFPHNQPILQEATRSLKIVR